jgi:outer membrane protein with beta-barrel domain
VKRAAWMFVTVLAAAGPVLAAEPLQWAVRARGLWTGYDKRATFSGRPGFSITRFDGGTGAELGVELRPFTRVGFELAASRLDLDSTHESFHPVGDFSTNPPTVHIVRDSHSTGEFGLRPLALALLVHPLPRAPVDLYFGPEVIWFSYTANFEGAENRESEQGFGAKLGVDVPLGAAGWALGLDVRYTESVHLEDEHGGLGNLGMSVATLGVSRRFGAPR